MAMNAPIQGTQADIIKLAMVEADKMIADKKWQDKVRLVMQVHDELVYEIEEGIVEEASRAIKAVMEAAVPTERLSGVPITAEAKIGKHWGEMEKLA
jgi:DNA polymerase-1